MPYFFSRQKMKQCFFTAAFLLLPLILISCNPVDPAFASKSVDQLVIDLKNSDGLVRAKAALALGAKKADAKPAIPFLIKGLGDSKPYVRNRMMEALGAIGEPAVPDLILVNTTSEDRNLRFFSGMALKKIPGDQAQAAYKEYMDKEGSKILKNF